MTSSGTPTVNDAGDRQGQRQQKSVHNEFWDPERRVTTEGTLKLGKSNLAVSGGVYQKVPSGGDPQAPGTAVYSLDDADGQPRFRCS